MLYRVVVSNVAREFVRELGIVDSDDVRSSVLKLSATAFFYHFLSFLLKFAESSAFVESWCREVERVSPFDLLALLTKDAPLKGDAREVLDGTGLGSLAYESLREFVEESFDGDETWAKLVLYDYAKGSTYESRVGDATLLPLHWFLLFELGGGVSAYKLSGVGVCEGFRDGDLSRRPFVGFFSYVKVDSEASSAVRSAVKNGLCLSVKTVKVFGSGKVERIGTRRGSPVTKEDFVRGADFQKVATTPFLPENKLADFGGLNRLPFEFSNVLWGPIALVADASVEKVLVSSEFPHPLVPGLDWVSERVLSLVNEFPYVPVATLVRPKGVVSELPLAWLYSKSSRDKTRVVVHAPRNVRELRNARAVVGVKFEVAATGEEVVAYFPSTRALKSLGASALDAVRVPCEFAEIVSKKTERANLGVLLWLEPLILEVGEGVEVPRWGVYFTGAASEFTGGVESVYVKYASGSYATTLETVRDAFGGRYHRKLRSRT